ncbi:hypothetical protein [Plantibacter sp. YIM 135249]|uniref:hypothetical protein n=1 Tax=Plantibacter sp. YIM 135249 TaxID=3423918 RepID=UPI003D32ADCD
MSDTTAQQELQTSVQEFVDAALSHDNGHDLAVALLREMTGIIDQRQPLGGTLSVDQAAYLIESGAFSPDELAETEASVRRGELAETVRATRLGAIVDSLSEAEVAVGLGVDVSKVGELQSDGALYSFIAGRERRYPLWQFTDDPARFLLPNLAALVNALPSDMHPASVQGFMATPQQRLRHDGRLTTPVDWLAQGGNPEAAVSALDSFLQA